MKGYSSLVQIIAVGSSDYLYRTNGTCVPESIASESYLYSLDSKDGEITDFTIPSFVIDKKIQEIAKNIPIMKLIVKKTNPQITWEIFKYLIQDLTYDDFEKEFCKEYFYDLRFKELTNCNTYEPKDVKYDGTQKITKTPQNVLEKEYLAMLQLR